MKTKAESISLAQHENNGDFYFILLHDKTRKRVLSKQLSGCLFFDRMIRLL